MTFVVAGGPVRDRGWIVGKSADALKKSGANKLFYLANDCSDDTIKVLEQEGAVYGILETGNPGYWRGDRKLGWKGHRYEFEHLANMRNKWGELALEFFPQATHFWSCDSDIVPSQTCLKYLLEADKPCIGSYVRNSNISYNFTLGRDEGGAVRNGHEPLAAKGTKPFEVTLTGACMLIRRDVLENVRWGFHKRGEDHIFADGCINQGYGMWFHPLARAAHHMGQDPEEVWGLE